MAEGGNSEDGVRQLRYVPIEPFSCKSSCVVVRQGPTYRRRKKATMHDERVRRKRRGRMVAGGELKKAGGGRFGVGGDGVL